MIKILGYSKPYYISILLMMIFLLIQVTCDLALPAYMSDIVDIGIKNTDIPYIKSTGIVMILLALGSVAANTFTALLAARYSSGLAKDIRKDVFASVENFSHNEFDKISTSSLITRTTNDVQQIQMVVEILPRIVIYAPILACGGIIKVVSSNSGMSWIIALGVAVVFVIISLLMSVAIPNFKKVQKFTDKLNLITRQALTGTAVIRVFGTQIYEENKFDNANRELAKTNKHVGRVMSIMRPGMMFVMNAMTLLIVYHGAKKVGDSTIEVGSMIAMITYATQIIMAFIGISMVSLMMPRASVSANRILEVLHTLPSIINPKKTMNFNTESKGRVEFKNVYFRYPKAEENILSNINFTAEPGKVTAIIGSTGSGKSTIINLILRFYDVTEGAVFFDGIDIKQADLKELRNKIGYIPQKAGLLSGTIASNLRYGNANASLQELENAAKTAQAFDFIDMKPEKFDTPVSQGATNVSGGQKQRLAIARALVKNPEVYLFDDSFSALDFKTDAELRKALATYYTGITQIVVTQRVGSIKSADKIIVLDKGILVGTGTHKELLKTCTVYKEIAESQLSAEELENEQE